MTAAGPPLPAHKRAHWPIYVLISVLAVVAGCCGAYRWFIYTIEEQPPKLTAEYESSEVFTVAEALAGQVLADLPVDEDGRSVFVSRSWDTEPCRSGWDDHLTWYGFVSVSVSYGVRGHDDDLAKRIEYVQLIADRLEELGLEPTLKQREDGEAKVIAERDDGLEIWYDSSWGLYVEADCVVEAGEVLYTPPHVRISPVNDHQNLERWPESE